jgi:hypothetical protein
MCTFLLLSFLSTRHPVTKYPQFMIFPQAENVSGEEPLIIKSNFCKIGYVTVCRRNLAVTVLNYVLQVPGWNIGQKWNVSQFYPVRRGEFPCDSWVRLRQISSKCFPNRHSPLVLVFDVVWPNIQRVSLNKPYINKVRFLVFQLTTFSWSIF